MGIGGSFPEIKWPGREADNLVPRSSEWSCTSAPPICLCGVDRDSFASPLWRRILYYIHTFEDFKEIPQLGFLQISRAGFRSLSRLRSDCVSLAYDGLSM